MSTIESQPSNGPPDPPDGLPGTPIPPLHRIRSVRQQQGISLRCAARRLHLSVEQVVKIEDKAADLPLTMLYRFQQLLDVPVADLLVDGDSTLSAPILKRARMVRIMKTAGAIHESAKTAPVKRLARMLIDQLIEIMPELKEVSPWHAVGQRRTMNEMGRIAEQPFPESIFGDALMH
jgi:transcriptional regulator with XRE-family HTH domain